MKTILKKESAVIISKIDRTQLVRIITNLVKNAIHTRNARTSALGSCKKEFNNVLIL
jgi:hypothetical protein